MTAACAKAGVISLPRSRDFWRVRQRGTLLKSPLFWAYVMPNSDDKSRIGISISARAVKRAVRRNRIKRIIREWFRATVKRQNFEPCDIVIVVRSHLSGTGHGSKTIRAELDRIFTATL